MFNPLARDNSCWLKNHNVIRTESDFGTYIRGIPICLIHRRILKIHDIRNDDRGHCLSSREFFLCRNTDHNMLHVRIARGKRHVEIISNSVHRKPRPFPVKIVMVSNSRNMAFSQQFSQCQPQRHVHGNADNIFKHNNVNPKLMDKVVQRPLQIPGHFTDSACYQWRAGCFSQYSLTNPGIFGVVKKGLWDAITLGRISVHPARVPETFMTALAENVSPLDAFQGYAIGSRKPCRNKTYRF